jgi:hypothetical protein
MTSDLIVRQFDRLNIWSRGGQRAPHKPLLVLYALGRWMVFRPASRPSTVWPTTYTCFSGSSPTR